MEIKEALDNLDPLDDSQWTSDGLPRLDAVSAAMHRDVNRKEITDARPDFRRVNATELTEPLPQPPVQPKIESLSKFFGIEDDVVTMPADQVYSDLGLTDRAIVEFSRQYNVLNKIHGKTKGEMAVLSKRMELLERAKGRLIKAGHTMDEEPKESTTARYQRRQQEARAKRVEAANKFIGAGTTAKDVVAVLQGKSKLDQALGQTKPPRGSKRPPIRVPKQQ